ncbi:GDPmannose 4,6-dehydratase, partial [Kaistia hirudinis]
HTVRSFVEKAFAEVGTTLEWKGVGVEEKGVCTKTGKVLVEIDPRYFRPTEVDLLIGDPAKAHAKLGWKHETGIDGLVKDMMAADLLIMANAPVLHNA